MNKLKPTGKPIRFNLTKTLTINELKTLWVYFVIFLFNDFLTLNHSQQNGNNRNNKQNMND